MTSSPLSDASRLRVRALACGIVGVFAIVFGGRALRSWNPLWGLFTTLWIVLPAITWITLSVTARGTSERAADRLRIRSPRARHALAAVLLAPPLALLATYLGGWELRIHSTDFRAAAPVPLRDMQMAARVLLLVVSPAIVEELFFRGALLAALRQGFSAAGCVALGAALFGAAHVANGSFAPAAVLGAVLTIVTLRARSLVPAILLHGAYNSLLVRTADVARPPAFDIACAVVAVVLLATDRTP